MLDAVAGELREQGTTVIYVQADGRVLGLLALADAIKPSTAQALAQLAGLKVLMVTGDHAGTRCS